MCNASLVSYVPPEDFNLAIELFTDVRIMQIKAFMKNNCVRQYGNNCEIISDIKRSFHQRFNYFCR